jgi:8-amino-7-oxononanoate synthase
MSERFETWLAAQSQERDARGLRRGLRPRQAGADVLDLAGNDYLGLSADPRVVAAANAATATWGTGSTGSRLVSGTTQAHAELETALAEFLTAPAALVFASGYAANLGAITALAGPDTLIVSDAQNHASIVDACRLSRSRVVVNPHSDLDAVAAALGARTESRAIVVVDAVFSVVGDLAPVADLHRLCRAHSAILVVDEAHAIGVTGPGGRGVAAAADLAAAPDVIRTVTLSKALGSQGGAVVGSAAVIEHLINSSRTFIFDTGLAPAAVGAARAALAILAAEPELVLAVHERAEKLAAGIGVAPSASAVVSMVLGDPELTVATADRCRAAGVLVGCFRPPSVPEGQSRLRLTARANLTDADIDRASRTVLGALPPGT